MTYDYNKTINQIRKREKTKCKISFIFVCLFRSVNFYFIYRAIEQNGTNIYKKKSENFHCGKVKYTSRLFMLDSEALMHDRREMMINFYYTSPYLEKIMHYPSKIKRKQK